MTNKTPYLNINSDLEWTDGIDTFVINDVGDLFILDNHFGNGPAQLVLREDLESFIEFLELGADIHDNSDEDLTDDATEFETD